MFRTHADDAAVHIKGEAKASPGKGNSHSAVQHFCADSSISNPLDFCISELVLDNLDVKTHDNLPLGAN
jgi:hypothetical protein